MAPSGEFDELEGYLASATVLDVATFSQGTAHRSYRLILEGGVAVMAKPEDTANEGVIMCQREAAAWTLARTVGWTDLVATTVMRTIASPTSGEDVKTSVQVIWPDYLPDAAVELFSDADIWRAAVFDVLVGHADRGGHNWLAVPGSSPTPRLKLIDHGYGFPGTTSAPSSTFYELRKGREIPDEIVETLGDFLRRPPEVERLYELLPSDAVNAVSERAYALREGSVLGI